MTELIEGRHVDVDLLVGCAGLSSENVVCSLKRAGAPGWRQRDLTPANWQDAGHGVYVLSLDPSDVDTLGRLCVLVEVEDKTWQSGLRASLHIFDVVPARHGEHLQSIPRTTICGHIITLDEKGRAKAQVIARVTQFPLIVGCAGICNDQVSTETNEEGFFSLSLVTGAAVTVQIPVLNYTRNIVVPPSPAPGIPVRLFTL